MSTKTVKNEKAKTKPSAAKTPSHPVKAAHNQKPVKNAKTDKPAASSHKPPAKTPTAKVLPKTSSASNKSAGRKELMEERTDAEFNFTGEKKKYYDLLVRIRNELTDQIVILADDALKSQKDSGGDLSAMSTHMADRGSDYFLRSMELDMITNESEVIEMIEEAIQRLVNDEFGICLDCGCKVSKARLEALPYARYCVDCKSIREQHGGLRPDYQD